MRLRIREESEDFWPAYADILMVSTLILVFVIGALVAIYNADDVVRKEIKRRQDLVQANFQKHMHTEITSGALKIEASGEQQRLTFSDTGTTSLLFEKGSEQLNPRGTAIMAKVADVLRQNSNRTFQAIQVNGHTDTDPIQTPRFPSNWYLSSARATTVVSFLANKGIRDELLSATGFSQYHPIDKGTNPEAMARNRRIEIVLLYPEWFIKGEKAP